MSSNGALVERGVIVGVLRWSICRSRECWYGVFRNFIWLIYFSTILNLVKLLDQTPIGC